MRAPSTSRLAVTLILLALASSSFQVFASPQTLTPANLIVAAKKTKSLLITLTTADGKLRGGENRFCVAFGRPLFLDCNRCGTIHELPWDDSDCPAVIMVLLPPCTLVSVQELCRETSAPVSELLLSSNRSKSATTPITPSPDGAKAA